MEQVNMKNLPQHIAIILDGNRRWAKARGLTTFQGHTVGFDNLETIAKFCNKIGIKYLTVYAFSTENWKRSKDEVAWLMKIFKSNVDRYLEKKDTENIRIRIIGEKENIPEELKPRREKIMEKTRNNTGLTLNICFNYGGRAEIVHATKVIAEKVKQGELKLEDITEKTISENIYTAGQPDPDLLIRTSKELRTSNFLTWQLTYTEFYFPEKFWPEFTEEDLLEAIKVYQGRDRRFGGRPYEKEKNK